MGKNTLSMESVREKTWVQYLLLSLIMLLALGMRFYKLGEWSLWIDEIYTILRSQANFDYDIIVQYRPPISVILTGGVLNWLGVSEWSARLVGVLMGIVTIPILFFFIRNMFGPVVALIAVLLLTVSPWHLFWSQNARFYTSLMLFYSLAFFIFFYAIEKDRPWYFLIILIFLYLAVIERQTALFLLPVIGCYLLSLAIFPFEKPKGYLRNVIIISLPVIAYIAYEAFRYITSGYSFFMAVLNHFIGNPIDDPIRLMIFILFDLGIPLIVFAFFSGIYLLGQRSRAGMYVFCGAVVPLLILILISPFLFSKDRYLFVTLPSWTILAGYGVKEIYSWAKGRGILLAISILIILVLDAAFVDMQYYTINHGHRRNWKEAFALIEEKKETGDVVVSTRAELGDYYLGEKVLWMGDVTPDEVMQSGDRYWFVTDSESVWVTGKIHDWVLKNAELTDVWYLRVPEDMSLRLYLYDPKVGQFID